MRRLIILLLVALTASAQAPPKINSILNGASYAAQLCPGTLASLFGLNLASTSASAASIPLATELAGTRVLIQDPSLPEPIPAPLYFVSATQINFQVPFEVVRSNITVTVSTPQGKSEPYTVYLTSMAPGIFSQSADGRGDALAFDADFKLLTRTPDIGSPIILYATGLGYTVPAAVSGSGGNATAPFNLVSDPLEVYVGGSKAKVTWAGLAPGFAGVYQLNVVPAGPAIGDVVIYGTSLSRSNVLRVPRGPLNSGKNTANITGTATIVYPTGPTRVTFSPAFLVAKASARFDIKPDAGRFTLSVSAKIGSTVVDGTSIQFEPALRQFTADVPSPTLAVRRMDFSSVYPSILVWDFLCGPKACPMPGNIVPLSRLDPALSAALITVPSLNYPADGIHMYYRVTGKFNPGSAFAMDSTNNLDLQVFASFGSIPYPTGDVPVSVALSVDGQLVDVATGNYLRP